MGDPELPWFPRALEVLDLRRRDRLLLAMPGSVAAVRAAAQLVGADGAVTVLEPRLPIAEAIAAELPACQVLALEPVGRERHGSFDAVLAVPFAGPLPPVAAWAGVVGSNLRPGGRFTVDLPGPDVLPDVQAAAAAAALPFADRLAAVLNGPTIDELVAALADAGLRRVQSLLGTHLLQLASPFDLAHLVGGWVHLDENERLQLGEALARRLRKTADVETLVHRASVTGMR